MDNQTKILNLIPKGRCNAISRAELRILMNLNDRQMREEIEQARHNGAVIINLQDGSGYFQATEKDKEWIQKQIKTNEKRAKSILHPNKYLKRILNSCG